VQIAAQAGGKLHVPSREVCEQSAAMGDDFLTDRGAQPLGQLEFDALVRVIDRRDPSYRN
jgi:hypothetical protein